MKRFTIGFHLGPGGNPTGIGDWMRELDAAGIQFYIKSADNYGPLNEAVDIARASGIRHVINYRMSSSPVYDFDVPNYGLDPDDAAFVHWQATIANLPPEYRYDNFARGLVWLEVINEVDKNRADWLGWFSLRIAKLAVEQGYRVALPSWSPGEPEPEHWEEPGMLEFLRYAADHSSQVAVSVHEYSLDRDDLFEGYPYLVGRIEALFEACDTHHISRPTTLITEFGWTYDHVPSPGAATDQLERAAYYYYDFPNVLGAGIWYLGPGFGGIADKAQRLIAPVKNIGLNFDYYDIGEPVEPPSDSCDFNDAFTKYHILRPENLSLTQWNYIKNLMENGVPASELGVHGSHTVKVGYEGWSHVDAILAIKRALEAGYVDSRLIVVDGDQIGTGLDDAWMRENCPAIAPYTVYRVSGQQPEPPDPPDPPTGEPALLGLHATADPALAAGELAMMRQARIEVVKVLSNIRKEDATAIANAFPDIPVIIRAFLDFGGRDVSPNDFLDWTYPDVVEIVSRMGLHRPIYLELHNEPNLYAEGLGASWSNGTAFNVWLLALLRLYRDALGGVDFLYPGLSPGPSVQGIRMDSTTFLDQSILAATACDGIAVHNYWSAAWSMDLALTQLQAYTSRLGSKPMWITEASNNRADTSSTAKANEYIQYVHEVSRWPNFKGVTYFVASASNPAWNWSGGSGEVWLGTDIPSVVGSR